MLLSPLEAALALGIILTSQQALALQEQVQQLIAETRQSDAAWRAANLPPMNAPGFGTDPSGGSQT